MSENGSIIDVLFPEPETVEEVTQAKEAFKDFLGGGSDPDTGIVQSSPFAQFGNVAYKHQIEEWYKRRNR